MLPVTCGIIWLGLLLNPSVFHKLVSYIADQINLHISVTEACKHDKFAEGNLNTHKNHLYCYNITEHLPYLCFLPHQSSSYSLSSALFFFGELCSCYAITHSLANFFYSFSNAMAFHIIHSKRESPKQARVQS